MLMTESKTDDLIEDTCANNAWLWGGGPASVVEHGGGFVHVEAGEGGLRGARPDRHLPLASGLRRAVAVHHHGPGQVLEQGSSDRRRQDRTAREDHQEVVEVADQCFAFFGGSPLRKYEAYRRTLERWNAAEEDEGPDLAPTVLDLAGVTHPDPSPIQGKSLAPCLDDAGHRLRGWNGVLAGDVPVGAGLSSSAANTPI